MTTKCTSSRSTSTTTRSLTTMNTLRSLRSSLEERNWGIVREILSSHSLPTFHETENGTDTVLVSSSTTGGAAGGGGNPSLPSCMDDEVECLTDAIQSLCFNANDIPFDIFTLFSSSVDLRHVIPSLRDNYDPKTIMYSCIMHELCLDNKHGAIRLLLSSLPKNVAALEAQRLDYMYIEYMSDDQAPGEEAITGFEFVHSPLQAAWEGTLFDSHGQHALDSISTLEDLRSSDHHKDITNLWRCTMHLLCSVEGCYPLEENNGDNVTWPLLHAIARIGCKGHAAIMWLALKLYPHLIRLKDEHGNLPIHVAAQNSLHYLSQRSQQDTGDSLKKIEVDDDKNVESTMTPTESFLAKGLVPKKLKRWQQPPIIMILQKDPQSAAIPNKDGSLPLHQFILHHDANAVKKLEQKAYHDHCMSNDSFDGYHMGSFATVKALTCEHPLALTTPDFKTGLHPFMMAASMKTIPLDVIYFLLSENPFYIVSHCISSNCDERTTSSTSTRTVRRKRSLSFFEEEGGEKKKHSLT